MYWVHSGLGAVVVIFHILLVFLRGCHAEALEASHQSYILLFTLYSYCSFFLGLRWGKALQGYLQAFPPKAIRQINNDMNENVCPEKAKLPQWLRNHCTCPDTVFRKAA